MGDEPDADESIEAPTDDHPPADFLLHGYQTPTPEEIETHPALDASPTEIYQYRQARAAKRQADAASRDAANNELLTELLLYGLAGVVLWQLFEEMVNAARY